MLSAPSSLSGRQIKAEIPNQAGPRHDSKTQACQEQFWDLIQIVDLYYAKELQHTDPAGVTAGV